MRKWLKRAGIGVGLVAGLVVLMVVGIYGFSSTGFRRTYEVADGVLPIPTDSASIAWGEHLAIAIGKCVECHGPDLAGVKMIEDPAMGTLASSNLTSGKGGIGATYTDADFVRALRHGVRPDGTPLLLMPSQEYTYMTDEDLAALIAYIRSRPPVDKEKLATKVGPVARALYLTKAMPLVPAEIIDHSITTRPAIARGVTREYGEYLVRVGCEGCHGKDLSGGTVNGPPGTPPSRNITPAAIGSWTLEDFKRALREGTRPDGTKISPAMPFVYTAQMTDDEIAAVWEYVKSVPPVTKAAR